MKKAARQFRPRRPRAPRELFSLDNKPRAPQRTRSAKQRQWDRYIARLRRQEQQHGR
jgi:predicted secreted Zn-dependent protease